MRLETELVLLVLGHGNVYFVLASVVKRLVSLCLCDHLLGVEDYLVDIHVSVVGGHYFMLFLGCVSKGHVDWVCRAVNSVFDLLEVEGVHLVLERLM